MNTSKGTYLLEPDSASLTLIRRYARQFRVSSDDAVLLRAQLALELRQHQLGTVPMKKRPAAA